MEEMGTLCCLEDMEHEKVFILLQRCTSTSASEGKYCQEFSWYLRRPSLGLVIADAARVLENVNVFEEKAPMRLTYIISPNAFSFQVKILMKIKQRLT